MAIGSKTAPDVLESASDDAKKKVYVGGDALYGPKTVVLAIRTGRETAAKIHQDLMG